MMAVMGDPDAEDPTPPRGIDADEYRRFLEFQRFQDYQRFVQSQQGANLPAPVTPAPPALQPPPAELEAHLAGMRQQLARIEKVTNPPTWQKILRNKWLHRALWLVIIVAVASWGVPRLLQHYFGGGGDQHNAAAPGNLPAPIGQSGALPQGPYQAVGDVYLFVSDATDPSYQQFLCSDLFTPAAARQFGAADGGSCRRAMTRLHQQVTPGAEQAYGSPVASTSRPPTSPMVISSCEFTVTDGPVLGTFTVVQQDKGWRITNYAAPAACPSSAPPT
jgi:hypothetical protein